MYTCGVYRGYYIRPFQFGRSSIFGALKEFRKSRCRGFTKTQKMEKTVPSNSDEEYNKITEGKAKVIQPKNVFYNPVQEFNRDLTIAVISQFAKERIVAKKTSEKEKARKIAKIKIREQKETENLVEDEAKVEELQTGKKYEDGIHILEGLAASGIRSMRFGLEIPGVNIVMANDFSKDAVEIIKKNIEMNGLTDIVSPSCGDASMVMYQHRDPWDRFDVIDLDPYGSPSVFLDSVVQAVGDGGLLCITCTDMANLCGNAPEACYAKYGSMVNRSMSCHEMALRIVLQSLSAHANRYSRYIVPQMAISVDFYIRLFVKVYSGASKMKDSITKLGMVYSCTGCKSFHIQKLGEKVTTKGDNFKIIPASGPPVTSKCEQCGHKHVVTGPIWADPLHNVDFVKKVIQHVKENKDKFGTSDRIVGILSMIAEELPDNPLYYVVDDVCMVLHCTPLSSVAMRSALLNAGFKVSYSHAAVNSVKTNATAQDIWDILRAWVKENPVSKRRLTPGSVVEAVLSKEPKLTNVSFEKHPDAIPPSKKNHLKRWQPNPERNWGPKPRAKQQSTDMEENRLKSQGKRKKQTQNEGNDNDENSKKLKEDN